MLYVMTTIPKLEFEYKYFCNDIMHPSQNIFDFYSRLDKRKLGTLVCHKTEIPIRPNYNDAVLAIDFLEVTEKNKGIGTKILKFAEQYSKKIGCNGFMTLKADGFLSPNRVPHTFYRKYGFSSFDKKTDKKLDMFIKQNVPATKNDFSCLIMHYPPKSKKSLKNKMQNFVSIIKNLKSFFNKFVRIPA